MYLLTLCSVDSPYIFTNNFPDVSGIFLDMDHKKREKKERKSRRNGSKMWDSSDMKEENRPNNLERGYRIFMRRPIFVLNSILISADSKV